MEDPVREIPHLIHLLTQSAPSLQKTTIETYFLPIASFTHPLCRTGSFTHSRLLILYIYRWYKIMSPQIRNVHINSVALDKSHGSISTLYVNLDQTFSIWAIPFHRADVNLTTVIKLRKDESDGKYYILSQEDLYQTDQWVRFFWFGGSFVVMLVQFLATLISAASTYVFSPVTWLEQEGAVGDQKGRGVERRLKSGGRKKEEPEFTMKRGVVGGGGTGVSAGGPHTNGEKEHTAFGSGFVEAPKGSGRYVTAPVSHSIEH